MNKTKNNIYLFHPYVTEKMRKAAYNAMGDRIIGQGNKVKLFENKLKKLLQVKNVLSLNSATSALELAYYLLDLKKGDEVISPVFTCTATNIPLVRRGVKIIFADIKDNLNLDLKDVERKISKNTKAIINVHLFNQYNDIGKLPVPIVGDASQYLKKTEGETFTAYSFQATKNLTTVDGGALVCKSQKDYQRAKLLRWYGIDRETDKDNIDVDIDDPGFKYHMNDVTAAIGLKALDEYKKTYSTIAHLQKLYFEELKKISGITPVGGSPFLIHTSNRDKLIKKLKSKGIEAGLVHRRNDIYSIFGGKKQNFPNMNKIESTYLLLPCHSKITPSQVEYIADVIRKAKS